MTRVLTDIDLDETPLSRDMLRVVNFRYEWLHAAGWSHSNADRIARATDIDWHFACDLIKKCPDQKLALQIIFGKDKTIQR